MYQGKRRIMNPERHEEYRSQAISFRGGAIFNAFIDLEDIINKSVFARTYMNHSQYWPLSPISSVCASLVRRIYLSYIYTPVIYRTHGNMKAFLVNLIVIVVGK